MPRSGRTVPLARLRALRTRPPPDLSIGKELERVRQDAMRRHRAAEAAAEAWDAAAPPDLRDRAAVVGIARGVLTVRVVDASARFTLDRWLRAGGESVLIRSCRTPLKRVRLTTSSV